MIFRNIIFCMLKNETERRVLTYTHDSNCSEQQLKNIFKCLIFSLFYVYLTHLPNKITKEELSPYFMNAFLRRFLRYNRK